MLTELLKERKSAGLLALALFSYPAGLSESSPDIQNNLLIKHLLSYSNRSIMPPHF
ncbi:exported hypothetical protein [Xenorhabdus szentirmaii DSM 16338]|uniref:Uncharacterized protein n=1 Tax=Xenorhabdus szentirmaii DSM 16338 TaxID=1427518 RepID=W1J4N9_9GAMM|nr:exported hypothetical protein [Xenorhabdus szentirmaii DSM 16338]